jgi:multidrug efflux system outer membrane protein
VNQRTPGELSRTGESELTRVYTVGAGVPAYELDLFGRVRSLKNAALEDYFSVTENRTAAQLLLVSEVANAWLILIADRELLRLAEGTRVSQRQSYDLTKLRFDQGVSSEIEVHRSESLWRSAEVDIAQQTRRVAVDRNALALLVGEPLTPETGNNAQALEAQTFGKELPPGLPADLLVRRPDVRAAGHTLRPPTPISARRARRSSEHPAHRFLQQRQRRSLGAVRAGHTNWVSCADPPAYLLGRRQRGGTRSRQRAQEHPDRAL